MLNLSEEIEQALDILFKVEKQPSKKQKLLDKGKVVYLQVVLFKIPFGAPKKRRFLKLRHSLYGDSPEICLFVPNRKTNVEYKKTTDEFIDFCVDYYTDLLEKHKVRGITTVMPLKQLRSEYGTYELRRKLVRRFDLFLCKNSLLYNQRFLTSLGKIFYVSNKLPLGVPFPKEDVDYDPDFQESIKKAIMTSSFYVSRFSDNYSIPFGNLSNTKAELTENLEAVLQQIFEEKIIPGGLKNIRALYVLPSQSKPVPLFINTELPSGAQRPRFRGNKRKLKGVEGELSSQPHKKVFVMPNGEVFVTKIKKKAKVQPKVDFSEDEESFRDESDVDDDIEEKKSENLKLNNKMTGNEEESESENDEAIEEKEARLLELKEEAECVYFGNKKSKNAEEKDNEEEQNEKVEKDEETHVKMNKKQKFKATENAKQNNDKKSNSKKMKVNKTKRKMLIKQNKFNANKKALQMLKSKQKNSAK